MSALQNDQYHPKSLGLKYVKKYIMHAVRVADKMKVPYLALGALNKVGGCCRKFRAVANEDLLVFLTDCFHPCATTG